MITAATHNAPNWVDLSTPDIKGALDFYRELFGWAIEKTTSPIGDYYIATVDGQQVGGMMEFTPDQEEMHPGWTTFFFVEDVDEMAARFEAEGGSVLEAPFDIPEARIAVVADPTGGMLGLISGPTPEGTWLSKNPGTVNWVELLTRDPETAESFYGAVFDWKADTRDYQGTAYTTFKLAEEPVVGMMMMPPTVPAEVMAVWGVYFAVADCAETVKRVKELDGEIAVPPMKVEMGHFAVIEDPQGAVFQIMDMIE